MRVRARCKGKGKGTGKGEGKGKGKGKGKFLFHTASGANAPGGSVLTAILLPAVCAPTRLSIDTRRQWSFV